MTDYLIAKRPEVLIGSTHKVSTPCGTLYLTLNEFNGKLFEIRLTLGKSGNCAKCMFEAIAVFISVLLQSNIPRDKIYKTLENRMDSNCSNVIWQDGERYTSCVDWIVRKILEEMMSRGEIQAEETQEKITA